MIQELVVMAGLLATTGVGAGCATVSAIAPPPDIQQIARVGRIRVSTDWLNSADDLALTLSQEIEEELGRCLRAPNAVDINVHIDDLRRASRVGVLLNGQGQSSMAGIVEFVEPRNREVLVRLPVSVDVPARSSLRDLLSDRQRKVSEEFGRSICERTAGEAR